jgi:hypothetical protein
VIEPALSAEAWADVEAGNGIPYAYGSSILDELLMLEGRDIPAAIAYLNHELPDSDPRKITRQMVDRIRGAADALSIQYSAMDVALTTIADALESYLPPDGA